MQTLKFTSQRVAIVILSLSIAFNCCKKVIEEPVPVIESINLTQASPGAIVRITGKNVNYVRGIKFGSSVVTNFTKETSNTLLVSVPPDLNPGRIDVSFLPGTKSVSLTIFEVTPKIKNVSPISAEPGEVITIIAEGLPKNFRLYFHDGILAGQPTVIDRNSFQVSVPPQAVTGPIYITNSDETIASPHYHINILTPEIKDAPIISAVSTQNGVAGDDIIVSGENFYGSTLVYFAGQPLSADLDFFITSENEIRIIVPADANSGPVIINNGSGDAGFEFVLIGTPVITRIIPEVNRAGGPLFIFGTSLEHVESLIVGTTTFNIDEFELTTDTDGQQVLYGRFPEASPGITHLSVRNNFEGQSDVYPYEVEPGYFDLPYTFTNVVFPNPPANTSFYSINNNWLTSSGGRFFMGESFNAIGDGYYGITNNSQEIIGFYKRDMSFISINTGNGISEGKIDDKYGSYPLRIVFTPVDQSGTQWELIFPIALDDVQPTTVNAGDSILITGSYLHEFNGNLGVTGSVFLDDLQFFQSFEGADFPGYIFLSDRQIKFRIPEDTPSGVHKIKLHVEAGFSGSSNEVEITVQ